MPTHSRTSSSASSVGSSYVSSTDSNKTSHIESPTPLQSQSLEITNNANFHTINGTTTTTLPSYQSAYKLINEHLNNQNGHKHNNNNENEDGCDNDQTDFNDLHHESSLTCNKLATIDQIVHETNGKPVDFINGSIKQTNEQIVCGENFAYKTLNGDVIRSVHPPGKGKAINYKVSVLCSCIICFYYCIYVFVYGKHKN